MSSEGKQHMVRPMCRLLMGCLALSAWGDAVRAADAQASEQQDGWHSVVCTTDGYIRDDELADYVCQEINTYCPTVGTVVVMVNSCYGGGLLDDFQRVFGDGGACAGKRWAFGSASPHDKCAYGWCDAVVNDPQNENKKLGSCWTSALAGPWSSRTDSTPGAMRDATSHNVRTDFETAGDNDA